MLMLQSPSSGGSGLDRDDAASVDSSPKDMSPALYEKK